MFKMSPGAEQIAQLLSSTAHFHLITAQTLTLWPSIVIFMLVQKSVCEANGANYFENGIRPLMESRSIAIDLSKWSSVCQRSVSGGHYEIDWLTAAIIDYVLMNFVGRKIYSECNYFCQWRAIVEHFKTHVHQSIIVFSHFGIHWTAIPKRLLLDNIGR